MSVFEDFHFSLKFRHFSTSVRQSAAINFQECNVFTNFGVYRGMTLYGMLLKRRILLIVGIVVAIVVGLYTGLFGMTV